MRREGANADASKTQGQRPRREGATRMPAQKNKKPAQRKNIAKRRPQSEAQKNQTSRHPCQQINSRCN
jgi:hypothetical protein